MHPDGAGHVLQYEGPQVLEPVVQELPLELHYALNDPVYRPLPLVHALYEPERALQLVLDIGLRVAGHLAVSPQELPVVPAYLEFRHPVFVKRDDVIVPHLRYIDVREYGAGSSLSVAP